MLKLHKEANKFLEFNKIPIKFMILIKGGNNIELSTWY
jgi:hypothetical protein